MSTFVKTVVAMTNKKAKNLELDILNHLALFGVGYKSDLNQILRKYYLKAESLGDAVNGSRWATIDRYLYNMRFRKLIQYTDRTEEKYPNKWMSPINFEAELTMDGLQYLYYLRNQELTEQLSNSTISTNKRTMLILWLTVVVSGASLVVSILDYYKTQSNNLEVLAPILSSPVKK